jgi:hypothetical protein
MLIATATGVYFLDSGGAWPAPAARFKGKAVLQVAEGRRVSVVALADSHLMLLSDKGSRLMTTAILDPITSLVILQEDPLHLVLGTEGARLYRITAGRGPADRIASFDALAERAAWHTPWGGPPAVRSLAATPDGWLYADIHVGSIMRSPDGGLTWQAAGGDLDMDVHQVAVCPAAPDRVYANTARSVFVSDDRGRSWQHRPINPGAPYGRAIAVHPRQPDTILATASDGPHGPDVHGRLYLSRDGGRTWSPIGSGFPDSTQENIDTFHTALTDEGSGWAVIGRTLYAGRDRPADWHIIWESPEPIRMISCHS